MAARNILITYGEEKIAVVAQANWTGIKLASHALKVLKTVPAGSYVGMEKVKNSGNRRISKKLSNFIDDRDEFSVTIQQNPTDTALRKWVYSTGGEVMPHLGPTTAFCLLLLYTWWQFWSVGANWIAVSMPVSMFISTLLAKRCPNRLLNCLPSFFRNKKNLVLSLRMFSLVSLSLLLVAFNEQKRFFQELASLILFLSTFTCSQLATCWSYKIQLKESKQRIIRSQESMKTDDVSDKEAVVDEAEKDALIAQKDGELAQKDGEIAQRDGEISCLKSTLVTVLVVCIVNFFWKG